MPIYIFIIKRIENENWKVLMCTLFELKRLTKFWHLRSANVNGAADDRATGQLEAYPENDSKRWLHNGDL